MSLCFIIIGVTAATDSFELNSMDFIFAQIVVIFVDFSEISAGFVFCWSLQLLIYKNRAKDVWYIPDNGWMLSGRLP